MTRRAPFWFGFVISLTALVMTSPTATAQQSWRPGGAGHDPISSPRDLSGYSVRAPRIRIVHTASPGRPGGSMWLQQVDPWLGYLWGRELVQREWTLDEGVFGEVGKTDGLILPDGATHMMSRDHVNSCASCHNSPYRDGGAGMTIPKNGGTGRNTPHFFGAGFIEMIGAEIRLAAHRIADTDRNGWIDLVEAKDKRFTYQPSQQTGSEPLDFGRFDDHDLDGKPDLNPVMHIVYVDGAGERIPWAQSLVDPGVKGYRLEVQVFGHGRLHVSNRRPIAGTLRAFAAGAFDMHQGLQAFDPTTLNEIGRTGSSQTSNAGCVQFISAAGRDRGRVQGENGLSLDDPDRDEIVHELTEGDLDVVEWYMLNHPQPALARQNKQTRRGRRLMSTIGCTSCHTPNWHLPAANLEANDYTARHAGDRRFFDLQVAYHAEHGRLEGTLRSLTDRAETGDVAVQIPRRGEFTVTDIFSDFRYHDMGQDFYQLQYDGSVVKRFRTPPLWGVGSSAPYGHDGASLDLESVIQRHSGEARESRDAYLRLNGRQRNSILAFLRSLVLYQTDRLACDIDGNRQISESFVVAGHAVGKETLRPEWLLSVPCQVEGEILNVLGEPVTSMAVTNVREAYGLDLEYLRDANGDGWPDVVK